MGKWHEVKDVERAISKFIDSMYWADNDLYSNVRVFLFISAI